MRSSWKALAAVAAGLFVAPQLAAADDVQDQLKKMQERMSQLEDRLQSTTDQLSVTEQRAAEQQQMLERAGVATASGSQSGLDSFLDSLEFGGYVDVTYNYNINHPDGKPDLGNGNIPNLSGANGLYATNLTDASGFNLQALKFELERPVSVENRGGFRADIVFGEQARQLNGLAFPFGPSYAVIADAETGAIGYDTKSDSQVHVSQAYAQYLAPIGDIKFTMGKMYTRLGAEVVDSPYNYNITRSILFYNLPIEHLGAMASKKYDNGVTWELGVMNGWDRDNGADFNKSKTLLARLGWLGENYGVLGNLIYGAEQWGREDNKRGVFDLVFTANPIQALSMYLQIDMGWEDFGNTFAINDGLPNLNQKTPFWFGIAGAGRYAITDRLGVALRAEWFNDDRSGFFCTQGANGAVVNLNTIGNNASTCAGTGINLASSAYEVTATLDYALTSQLTARAEFRSDWVNNQEGSDDFFRSATTRANYLQANQQVLAAQLYYRF
ncbi:MAG: outer membrane beta-barrel protein [Deltaproteobacteria bacterium]|nr:outer membrane beta-barrel protein [Deltaproteobacteria bacterium]